MSQCERILIVDDDKLAIGLMRRAAPAAGLSEADLFVCADGREAIDHLTQLGSASQPPALPQLMLLDLNLPRFNGYEVLQWLGQRPEFRPMTVIVLSNSAFTADFNRARTLGAAECKTKPYGIDAITRFLAELRQRYLG